MPAGEPGTGSFGARIIGEVMVDSPKNVSQFRSGDSVGGTPTGAVEKSEQQ
jgi:hypothetical protein